MTTFQKAHRKQLDPVSQFLLWFAGVDVKILQQMDLPIDVSKYVALGIMIMIACLFAGFSAFVFMLSINIGDFYSIRGSDIKIVFSIIWGIFIFSVDRFLLTSFKKKEFSLRRIFDIQFVSSIVFRLALCFVIASFVATEIELSIFSSEISQQLQKSDMKEITDKQKIASEMIYSESPNIAQILDNIQIKKADIEEEKNTAKQLGIELTKESNGEGGSRQRGNGLISDGLKERQKASWKKTTELQTQLERLEQSKSTAISPYTDRINKELKKIEDTVKDSGSLKKKEALENYLHGKPAARLHAYRIQGLLNLIELMPVLLKILSPYSNYDKALFNEDTRKFSLNKIHTDNDTRIQQRSLEIEFMEANVFLEVQKNAVDKLKEKIDELSEPLVAEYSEDFHESRKQIKTIEVGNESANKSPIHKSGKIIMDIVAIMFLGTKDKLTAIVKITGNIFNWVLKR